MAAPRRGLRARPTTLRSMAEYIFTLKKARKAHGDKVVLDDVTLAFLPGAKIGVVGPNGAGQVFAAQADGGDGPAEQRRSLPRPGATVGILLQEPELDPEKSVLGNVGDGVAETKAMLARFDAISAELADPEADYDSLLAEMGTLQGGARPSAGLGSRCPTRAGDGRAEMPATGRRCDGALRW